MIEEILKTWQDSTDLTTKPLNPSYKCKFCGKEYRRLSTLSVHLCETKRRWQQEKEVGVQFGLQAYLRFYELTQGSARTKSYADFIDSPYYGAFVKFGRHLVAIRAVNPKMFIDWVIKENKKLDHWCKDSLYSEYLSQYIRREAVQDAVERSLMEMQAYADEGNGIANFKDYFRFGNSNRVCYHITTGRISPWVLFNCSSGVEFLESINEEQLSMILPWVDPEFWQQKFKDYIADSEWTKMVLKEAGL